MNTELIKSLAKLAKVDNVEDFTTALQSENDTSTYDFSNLIVRTKEDDETIKSNLIDEQKSKNFKDAFEIQIKNMKKDLGLEFEGKKREDFVDAFKKSILDEANIEPNNKISELTDSLTKVQKLVDDKNLEISDIKNQYIQKETKLKAQSYIPNLSDNLGISKAEAASLFWITHEQKDDGIYKDGQKLKDKVENPLSLEQAVGDFVTEKKWNETIPAGRGGGSGAGGKGGADGYTLEDWETEIKEKGLNVGSAEANALLVEKAKDNPELLN